MNPDLLDALLVGGITLLCLSLSILIMGLGVVLMTQSVVCG